MIGQRSYAGTGDAIQYNKRFFHLSSMAPRAQTMPNRKLRPKPQWALEDSIRHSPGFGIVPELVRNDADWNAHRSDNIGKVRTKLLDKGLLVAWPGQEPAVKGEWVERTEEAQAMDDLTNVTVHGDA